MKVFVQSFRIRIPCRCLCPIVSMYHPIRGSYHPARRSSAALRSLSKLSWSKFGQNADSPCGRAIFLPRFPQRRLKGPLCTSNSARRDTAQFFVEQCAMYDWASFAISGICLPSWRNRGSARLRRYSIQPSPTSVSRHGSSRKTRRFSSSVGQGMGESVRQKRG